MSESRPEPTDVGPAAGGHLRASDADREQVATVLSTAFAEGRLTREEHDERLDRVMAARTFDELVPITHDLVITTPQVPAAAGGRPYAIEPATEHDSDTLIAIFGGATRTGRWHVKRKTKAIATFGGIDLDMRTAVFEGQTIEIAGMWVFGGMDIKVPEGIEVRDQTVGIFGGSDVRNVGAPQPGAPTLIIKGLALFGGVSVSGPKPKKPR